MNEKIKKNFDKKTLKQLKEEIKEFDKKNDIFTTVVLGGLVIMCIAGLINAFFVFIQRVFFG